METTDEPAEPEQEASDNQQLLDFAIEYCMHGSYPPGLTKDKKRAVRKRAKSVSVENGEVFIKRKKNKVIRIQL